MGTRFYPRAGVLTRSQEDSVQKLADGRIYYDISPEISSSLAVFPGDTPFERKVSVNFEGDANYLASSIHGTVHLGAHVDAPNHYDPKGSGIHQSSLGPYLGDCQVISVGLARGKRIAPRDIENITIRSKRVLFRTRSFPNPNHWNADFNSLSGELVQSLALQGVALVGIDTPSIDLADDKVLESHHAIAENKMSILEGIILDHVPDGIYTLIALPLKIRDADASPVRAILIGERV
jgi:arylformamidase